MMREKISLGVAILGLLLAGCDSKTGDDVLMVVNGHQLTVGMVRDMVLLNAKMAELSGNPVKESGFADWANQKGSQLLSPMANLILIDNEVSRSGVRPDENDRQTVLDRFNRLTGKKAESLEALSENFGELRAVFQRYAECQVRIAAYERQNWQVDVTEGMLDRHYAYVSNRISKARSIDALAQKRAMQAYERLEAGESWAKVAKVSEEKPEGGRNMTVEWTTVGADALGIKELACQLPSMKKGGYTRPFDIGDGMAIVRLNGKSGKNYVLSRILFRMAARIENPGDRDSLRRRLTTSLKERRRSETIARLQAAARFDYPHGTNYTFRIWPVNGEKK